MCDPNGKMSAGENPQRCVWKRTNFEGALEKKGKKKGSVKMKTVGKSHVS